jgi:DNA polymerase-3 subunit gamma/tau
MSYLVLARKWRPGGFDDLVGQEPIMRILKNAISQGRIAHAYLFSGPRGVGKTSSARILAKALNCKEGPSPAPCGVCESCTGIADGSSIDVIEIDGASNNSVDDIRDLRERVKYAPSGGRYKVYIIDEAHMLSGSAFNALLKTLEEPPPHVIFVLATTEMKKIPATVLSRCQHMPFRRISGNIIRERLTRISESEGIHISSPALGLVARAADGSMRDSLTILDQLSSLSEEIREEDVKNLLGIADFGLLAKVANALITGNRMEILEAVSLLSEQGADIRSFARELVQFFRDLLVASVMRKPEDVLDLNPEEMTAVRDILAASSEDQLTLMLSEIMKASADVRSSSSPRLALEMALIRASFLSTLKPLKEVIENIGRYGGNPPEQAPRPAVQGTTGAPREASGARTKQKGTGPENLPGSSDTAAAPAGKGISAPEDMQKIWGRTTGRIDPPLSSVLQQAGVQLQGDELLLTLESGHATVFQDTVRSNLGAIEKVLREEAGRDIKVKLTTSNKKPVRKKELKEKIMEEPLVREALELFEGRIVDVNSTGKSTNTKNGGDHV